MAVSGSSSTSNVFSQYGFKTNRIGGLASGLDVDSLVESLTTSTRSKIAKQGQEKQLLNWKMTAYRSMASGLTAFQKKYISYSSSSNTNISSNTFFNTYKASSDSAKVSVKTTTNSQLGSFSIDSVRQLAAAQSLKNQTKLSADLSSSVLKEGAVLDADAFSNRTLQLNVDGKVKTIKLDTLNTAIRGDGTLDAADFQDKLQQLVDTAFGTKNVNNPDYDATVTLPTTPTQAEIDEYNLKSPKYVQKSIIEVGVNGSGYIKLDSDAAKITIAADCDSMGFRLNYSNRVSLNKKLSEIPAFQNLEGNSFTFSINGTEISVGKNETLNTLMSKINNSDAGVRMTYSGFTDEFTLTSKSTGAGDNIVMRDVAGNLMNTLYGCQGGNGVSTGQLMLAANSFTGSKDLATDLSNMNASERARFAKSLGNMEFSLTYNGETKTVKADASTLAGKDFTSGDYDVSDIVTALNKGIKSAFGIGTYDSFPVSFTDTGGKVSIRTTSSDVAFSISQSTTASSYDMLNALGFNGAVGNTVVKLDYKTGIEADNAISLNLPASKTTGTFEMTVNGVTKQIQLDGSQLVGSTVAANLNAAVKEAFGKEVASKLSFSLDNTAKIHLEIKDSNVSVAIGAGSNVDKKYDLFEQLGFQSTQLDETGTVNNLNDNPSASATKLCELRGGAAMSAVEHTLTINTDSEITYSKDSTLQDLMRDINLALEGKGQAFVKDGTLSIRMQDNTDISISDDGDLLASLFGLTSNSYTTTAKDSGYNAHIAAGAGKNAEIVVDGVVMSSASNTFNLNGVDIEVNAASEAGDPAIKIGVSSNPDDVVTRLKDWVTDYNALLLTLNTAINEEQNRNYEPLTDEQKSGMTTEQIKTWETEAKKGILRSDSTLRGIVSSMREEIYKKVEAAGISLYDIGITTKPYNYNALESGLLEMSESGEAKLRALLESDPDKVRILFTDTKDGLATRMNTIIDKAAKTSSVNRGSLITLAGTESLTGDNSSVLGRKIDDIDKYVTTLKTRLETEYNRYWKKFSSLETAIQKMSSQSSWLSSQ